MVSSLTTAAKIVLTVTLVLSACLVPASVVHARTADIVVGPEGCGDDGYVTDGVADNVEIQAALTAASNGDVIQLCQGPYVYADDVIWTSDHMSVTLRGAGIGKTILDGQYTWNLLAVYASSFNLTVESLTLKDSFGGWGSAVLLFDDGSPSSLTLDSVEVTGGRNPAWFNGGTVTVENGSITIQKCRFEDNYAVTAGAVYASDAVSISNSTFKANWSDLHGGAVWAHTVLIDSSTFEANRSFTEGGAVFAEGDATISNSRFVNNSATEWGGALSLAENGVVGTSSVTNTTFSGNMAKQGGAIDSWGKRLILRGDTFSGNTAWGYGGAITRSGRTSRSDVGAGNRFTGNSSPKGSDVALYYRFDFTKSLALRDARLWSRARVDIQVVPW